MDQSALALSNGVRAPAPAVRQIVRKSAYASHRGCSPAYVSKLIREGKLTSPAITPDDLIDVALADAQLSAMSDPARVDDQVDAQLQEAAASDDQPTFAAAKTRREEANANIAEMELAKRRGELVDRQSVFDAFYEIGVQVRDALSARRLQLAQSLAVLTDPAAIALAIDEADRAMCEKIAADSKQKAEAFHNA
jgi:hypothetical protein